MLCSVIVKNFFQFYWKPKFFYLKGIFQQSPKRAMLKCGEHLTNEPKRNIRMEADKP